jgi:hypothetical protein
MNTKHLTRLALSAAIAATLLPAFALAQDAGAQDGSSTRKAQAKPDASKAKNLDQVVVTGNAATGGLRKIDTSYSVTTATAEQIKMANPKSTADLLKISPGLWPESPAARPAPTSRSPASRAAATPRSTRCS